MLKRHFFLRVLFSYMDEKQKLELIRYNKSLQENINISLINYKIFSGRYIIYGKNGKGKEYNYDDKLLFEGEYLNGKRNGKGKEYYSEGELKFEGEYLNGKRWYGIVYNYEGKRIHSIVNGDGYFNEYNKKGKLIYEGEYKNGEKNGKGKEYYDNGKLLYEGEYKNGKKEGKGKI